MSCGDETCHLSATGRGGVNRDVSCEMWVGCAVRVVLLLTRLLSHKDKDHHRGRCRPVTDQSQGVAQVRNTCLESTERQNFDNLDHTMIGYRHPPLFTHEHGCVIYFTFTMQIPDTAMRYAKFLYTLDVLWMTAL